jgi:uncharacterized protein (DUF1697 family)
MTIYIALLRGINVGGHNKIKMADLRGALEGLGLNKVQTYIQSGNIVFESEIAEEKTLSSLIQQGIATHFGLTISVILRTAEEFKQIIRDCPYDKDSLTEGESIHCCLLNEAPSQKEIDLLVQTDNGKDEYQIIGREIYVYFHQSMLDSKLSNQFQKFRIPVTMRNWNTMNKLLAMVSEVKSCPLDGA